MSICDIYKAGDISSLPVDPIAAATAVGVKTVSYSDICGVYCRSMEEMYRESRFGFSFEEDGKSVIAVNENACGLRRRRFTVAHELGHCVLGHVGRGRKPNGLEERAADRFAAALLAPVSVLRMCGVSSPEETARLCGITITAARLRFSEITRGGFGEEDALIIMRFSGFIDRYLQCKSVKSRQIDIFK
ncbi:MAG: ImmA/IrrE family metallo-endopeptidase [Ruminococcaceae bacterium]|nr:ImmA/IrrE family metallo-endopeptidase [Oscillospiraceae bacterium]